LFDVTYAHNTYTSKVYVKGYKRVRQTRQSHKCHESHESYVYRIVPVEG